jgi:APA family basic amino acid/polyamine antiporter
MADGKRKLDPMKTLAPLEAAAHSLEAEAEYRARRAIGSPTLFAVVYSTVAAALYFSIGQVADRALGLTPVVFGGAALFFVLGVMTYVEGASLHQERAGATVFARYAFNELVSFVAGWAILLDFVILVALAILAAVNYLSAFWGELGHGLGETLMAIALLAYVGIANVVGFSAARIKRIIALTVLDIAVQILLIVIGLALVFNFHILTDNIHLGSSPGWDDVGFALAIAAAAAVTGLDASSGLAGEVAISRRGLKRLVAARGMSVLVLYVGISLVALTAVPVVGGHSPLGHSDAPLLPVVAGLDASTGVREALRYLVAGVGALALVAAANSSMLGLSRLTYSLATNRQIPSLLGRLHPTRATPFMAIGVASALAIALVLPHDLGFLVSIYAFGAMLTMTIAHLSVIVLRFREPTRDRPYRIPFSIRIGEVSVPLPAVLGGLLAFAGWVSVLALHQGARYVGLAWMAFGLVLYIVYRLSEGKPLLKRVTIPASALTRDEAREKRERGYGSILVPLLGTSLDDDIVQTAGRLAASERDEGEPLDVRADEDDDIVAEIEAIWVFEVPLSLPVDAALPEKRVAEAKAALARAKRVGEEYQGVEVNTAIVRARRAGAKIVEEARRRGVEVIVMAAEEPSRIRGGALLGGRGGPLENYVGDATRHVVDKAPCRVILTAPPATPPEGGARPAAPEGDAASTPSGG